MLQIRAPSTFTIYAVIPRSVVSSRVSAMVSKRAFSSSSKTAKNDNKCKGKEVVNSKTAKNDNKCKGKEVVKESGEKNKMFDIQTIREDPRKIEVMTVQELRTALRNVGVPARGLKSDLVSALRCFLEQKPNGESASEVQQPISSSCNEGASAKEENEILSSEGNSENIDTVLEVSKFEGTKKSVKQSVASDESVRIATKSTKKQKMSHKSEDVSGTTALRGKRKVSSKNVSKVRTSLEVDASATQTEPWTVFAHKKPQSGWVAYNPRTMRPPPLSRDVNFVKLMSWNVNGLRALLKLQSFSALQLAQREDFDVLCLQETKLQEKDVKAIRDSLIDGYDHSFWTCSASKLGYSGTAIISRKKPLSVKYGLGISDHDSEGRLVTAEFDSFYLLNAYVPNSGDGLRRLSYRITEWDQAIGNYMKELEKSKPVILTGDLNCAHEEIDIYNPAGNRRSAGFTDEERQSFEKNFLSQGFVDTFRKQHPGVVGYTYWGYRHGGRKTNKGWRLDYFLVSESIADKVYDSYILPDVTGSDHSPIGLVLKL